MGGTTAGDEDIVAELSSTDPKVTGSRKKEKTRGQMSVVVGTVAKPASNVALSTHKRRRSGSASVPAYGVDPE